MIRMRPYNISDTHRIDVIGLYSNSIIFEFQELMGGRWVALGEAEMATKDYIEDEYGITLEEV